MIHFLFKPFLIRFSLLVSLFVSLCAGLCISLCASANAFSQTASSNTLSVDFSTLSQQSNYATGPHIQLALLSNKNALVAGDTVELGVIFAPDPQWHTYWRNPGDSGESPTIEWESSQKLVFGDINWPIPKAISVAHLVNYGYEGANLLSVAVTLPSSLVAGEDITISANVSWLVCKEDCIPGWATLTLTLPVANSAKPSVYNKAFLATANTLPQADVKPAYFEVNDQQMVFEMEGLANKQWRLFPFRSDLINHAASQQILVDGNKTRVVVPRSDYFNGQATQLSWLLSDGETAVYFDGLPSDAAMLENEAVGGATSLFIFIVMAFAGGLILNLMPCVLPILSIKAMALQNMQHGLSHKLAYLFGVLFCFNAFALLIYLLQQSGQQVGWGFHMQEPSVVLLLAFLFTFIALVLLDAIAVSSRFAGIGQSLVSGETPSAHFATGVLAVIVASPCTAPFMAAALGIALVSEPAVTFIIFNALAIGFALPLTLLFMLPQAKKLLPKPGEWMETFKHVLAFPMFATVAWLCWVFAGQLGSQAQFALMLALILFSMFAWLLGRAKRGLSKYINIFGIVLTIALPLWFSISAAPMNSNATQETRSSYVAFSPETLSELRNNNQIVVVNMTADWCITCKVNEQVALSSTEVQDALKQEGVQYMVGDWTNKNTQIFEYLSQYERAGVPLYVVYAGNKHKQVLPQILSPSTVIDAINQAKKELNHE